MADSLTHAKTDLTMTGKEFFGKLLNNRQEENASWDEEKSRDAAPTSEVDVADTTGDDQAFERPAANLQPDREDASYVDAPVSDLRPPGADDPSSFDEQTDYPSWQHAEQAVPSLDESDATPASFDARTEAEGLQVPGGDGLSSDLPEVSPSRHVEELVEHVGTSHHNEVRERGPEAYLGGNSGAQDEAVSSREPDVQSHSHYSAEPAHEADYRKEEPVQHHEFHTESVANERSENTHAEEYNSPELPREFNNPSRNGTSDAHVPSAPAKMPRPNANGAASPENHPAQHQESVSQPVQADTRPQVEAAAHHDVPPHAHSHYVEPPVSDQPPNANGAPAQPESPRTQPDAEPQNAAPAQQADTVPVANPPQRPAAPQQMPPQPPVTETQEDTYESPASEGPVQAEAPTTPEAPAGKTQAPNKDDQSKDSKKESKAANVSDADVANIKDRVVQRLLEKNVVTVDQVKNAIADRTKAGLKATLWRILAQQATVDRERVYREAALTYAFVERKIDEGSIDVDFIRQVAEVFPEKKRNRLIELHIVPIGYEFEQQTQLLRVVFITHDPSLPVVRELMQDLNLERYELQYASETTVKDLLARAFPKKNEYLERMTDDPLAYDLGTSYEDEKSELIDEDALEAEINRSSLINLFEGALVEAVHRGASDIHIYPNARRQIEIHFRVDGRLLHWHTEDKIHPESLLAVIKDNTMNVDRFERDMAQDGFIQRKVDETLIRYRVSILPIASASNNIHAESIVIRVLDDRKVITDLSKLGLLKGALERFDMAIRQPHGMVILTGPTGSGKSTTLVAALHQVVTPEVNVLTVEDPVEYIIPDVRQIKLNHKLGLEGALRAILRHDPDVVMVGEMRDRATAELAVKLANTGHLTFSTLHTNDAPSAVSRLYKMGVEPFLIAYAINLVVAQRLLRTLCPKCKIVDNDPDHVLLERLGFTDEDLREYTIFKASGDPTCKTCKGIGFKGRRAISEALYFSREIRHMIVEADSKIDEDGLRDMARSEGMLTLQDSAREVVKMGETSVDEMMRVTMTEE